MRGGGRREKLNQIYAYMKIIGKYEVNFFHCCSNVCGGNEASKAAVDDGNDYFILEGKIFLQ